MRECLLADTEYLLPESMAALKWLQNSTKLISHEIKIEALASWLSMLRYKGVEIIRIRLPESTISLAKRNLFPSQVLINLSHELFFYFYLSLTWLG